MKTITACRCCGSTRLCRYLDLGHQPLANSYHKGENLETYPLEVDLCESCYHSQLSVVIEPKIMFEHYLYVSSTTKTFQLHCDALAENAVTRTEHPPRVLDIACNDGLLLECFRKRGCEVQGVDPSVNLREFTKQKDIPVEVEFWSDKVADRIGKFDIITGTNVFAHVHDVSGFLSACQKSLTPNGFVIIEFPYCKNMIAKGEFDTIYHEHLSYFLVNSFSTLTRRCGFQIFDIIQTPIHGWSIRFFLRPSVQEDCAAVKELIAAEKEKGMLEIYTYKEFEQKVNHTKETFCQEVESQRRVRKVIGYGASAKGNTMLNFFKLKLDYIVDDNCLKWEHLTPGMDIVIRSPQEMAKEGPLATTILSWNFSKEIIRKITAIRPGNNNDVSLLYVPETKVLSLPLEDENILAHISG